MAHHEDLNSHELRSTHYQSYQDSSHHPNLDPNLRNQNRNAFGDDSDSEEDHHNQEHHNPERFDSFHEFDVYNDFNNSGVRYATLLNQNKDENLSDEDLNQPIHPTTGQAPRIKSNLVDLDKQGAQDYPFKHSITTPTTDKFNKDSKLKLGSALKTPTNRWRVGSIVAFIAVACIGTLIFFLIPRQPYISFEAPIQINSRNQVEANDNSRAFNANNPTNFSFDARVSLSLDGRGSYLPTLIRNFKVIINDLGSTSDSVRLATGQLDKGFTASSSKLTPLNVDITFTYNAKNSSDTLWQNWRKACGNINQSKINGTITRPSLQLYMVLTFNVIGMIGSRSDATQLNNVACPLELPADTPSF